jgi:hypothetical protein
VAATCAIAVAHATDARAYDNFPCGKQQRVSWSPTPVQLCRLTDLLDGDKLPVYTMPTPHAARTPTPRPRIYIGAASQTARITCQRKFAPGTHSPVAVYWHPNNRWYNSWWGLVTASDKRRGWVPEAFFKGGNNNEADLGLRRCTARDLGTSPTPPPPTPPSPRPSPCRPTPAVSGVKLRARFRHSRRVASPRYGQRPVLRGSLKAGGGPVANASICVGVQKLADGRITQTGTLHTDARGRFSYKVPKGESRRLWFVHRTGKGGAADHVDLRVRAPVSMRSSKRSLRNGEATLFHGQIRSSGDKRGLLVELQYPQGGTWQTFATVNAGKRGRFAYRYRFTRTVGTFTYRLRARVPAQRGYPFYPGASRRIKVRVSG